MKSSLFWKIGIVAMTFIVSIYLLLPTIDSYYLNPEKISITTINKEKLSFIDKIKSTDKIKLGLDLQGGIHLVLGVEVNKALENELEKYIGFFKDFLNNKKFEFKNIERIPETFNIKVQITKPEEKENFLKIVKEDFQRFIFNEADSKLQAADTIIFNSEPNWISQMKKQILEQAKTTIKNRIDEFSVSEPIIQSSGDERIIIQLPGIKDPSRALEIIRKTALLEFKIVNKTLSGIEIDNYIKEAIKEGKIPEKYTVEQVNAALKIKLPADTEILFEPKEDPTTKETSNIPYLLNSKTMLTGDVLEDARVRTDSSNFNYPYVSLQMNERGAEVFEEVTDKYTGELLAIVLDNKVMSAPVIKEKISKTHAMQGMVSIQLNSMQDMASMSKEAEDLVIVLRAGSLPAPVEVLNNITVGPTLGRDSINQGSTALWWGCLIVVLFMILYYRFSGLIADLAVIFNVIYIMAVLALLGGTLTLPGLAGIALTVGMAVDANVIINERIREELRLGKTPKAAITVGYDRAHITVLDANLTTLIVGVVLLQYGTGPIQGFAVTLILGLISSYITAVWFTRWFFEALIYFRGIKRLSIGIKVEDKGRNNG